MSTQNQNKEKFSFHLGKFKFDSTQPGAETRKTLALVGVIVIMLMVIVGLTFYFLKINLLTAGLLGGGAKLAGWIGKGGRSP